jgi:tRNA threonylcarbamoyladenosine biosynthesis protein TsaB
MTALWNHSLLILALETSHTAGSVALLNDGNLLRERTLDPARRSAQTLAPAIEALLTECQVMPREIGLVAATIGPGSFTGLRVGVTTAKTLAYAIGCDIIGLDTLDVAAAQTPASLLNAQASVQAVLDAQRRELFVATYQSRAGQGGAELLSRTGETQLMAADAWLAQLSPATIVTGPGLGRLVDRLPAGVVVVPPELREPLAATVGRLAFAEHSRGRRDDLWKLAPLYIRPIAAEEQARKRPPA